MPKDYAALPPNQLRRSDRGKDDAWIREFLHRAPVGVLATVHDEQPFINSNLYVYDESANAIYMHTGRVGRTQANVDHHERVCFSIMEMGRLLPADEALEFSVEYSGVVVFGRACLIDGDEAKHALQMLLDKYAPHLRPNVHYRPTTDDELKRTAVYRIEIDSWSGKQKQAEADFPGAYYYGQPVAVE
jgi:nitroimidazol reductase NimA-like FMN-containing flavoprotein (pyridoxamine 5'-phosphate oxidase superfamily)